MFYDAIAGTAAAAETTEEEVEGTVATGEGTVATGEGTVATGEGTVATGEGTEATGEGTVATGEGTEATGEEEGHREAVHLAEEEDEVPRNSTLTMGTGPAQTLGACPMPSHHP
jgi:autotransporter adhesin